MQLHNFDFKKKIFYHPEKIVAYKQGKRPFPTTVEIDLTNRCNHRCSFCFYAEHLAASRDSLETDVIKARISEMAKLGTRGVSFTGGGEPLLHRDYAALVEHTTRAGIDVGTITNGFMIRGRLIPLLCESASWVRISMGGGDAKSYEAVQGVDQFDRILGNVKALCTHKAQTGSGLNIGVRILVTRENLASLDNIATELLDTGLDYLQLAQDQFTPEGDPWWGSDEVQERLAVVESALAPGGIRVLASGYVPLQGELARPRTCYAHFFQVAITAEGDVVFCKNARGEERFTLGNINTQTLEEIWASERNRSLEDWVKPSTCGLYCKNIALNLAMEETLHPDPDMSPNFVS